MDIPADTLHDQEVHIDPPAVQAAPFAGASPAPPSAFLPDLIRYLYFMRFSIFLWLSMPVLATVDWLDPGAAQITRGILTPFSPSHFAPSQWLITGFIVVLPGWFALLAARIVCAYGPARFGSHPPRGLSIHNRMEWFVFWGAQLPGLTLLVRIACNSHNEENQPYLLVATLLAAGAFLALCFWYLVAILYYWTYVPDVENPALAFLVPAWSKLHLEKIEKLEPTASIGIFRRFIRSLHRFGDGYSLKGGIAPGHVVATIALLCAVGLYFIFMPISAPEPLPVLAAVVRTISSILGLYIAFVFLRPALHVFRVEKHIPKSARILPLVASCVLLGVVALGVFQPAAPRAIPVIGYVVILLVVLFWGLSGVAFFADHFRLPVLTTAAVAILIFNLTPAEHTFRVNRITDPNAITAPLPTPEDFLDRFALADPAHPRPVIVIAATGGGIHAAAWTATVLNELDRQFAETSFHNHILLLSTVSGGSVGATGFLREYFAPQPFQQASYARIQQAAHCSSLQAVAWGLAYPDALRLLVPSLFNGISSLDQYDRGWALESAIERNMHDKECIPDKPTRDEAVPDPSRMTLNTMVGKFNNFDQLPANDPYRHFPAFTLNTTAVETGDRFLLSNYSVFARPHTPDAPSPANPQTVSDATSDVLPAGSFLGIYGRKPILPIGHPDEVPNRGGYADLSLLTAARLSASFTYVSPATRLPLEYAQGRKSKNAFHFVDGGYFDNDGVNSAIEFLKVAFHNIASSTSPNPATAPPAPPRLHVLFIEIRDSQNIDNTDSPDSYTHQAGLDPDTPPGEDPKKQRTGPTGQLLAPPLVAIRSGFSSVTRRNRRELDTLKQALARYMDLDPVVLDYQPMRFPDTGKADEDRSELDQPLSWHLTQRQRDWIEGTPSLQGALDRPDRRFPIPVDRQRIAEAVTRFRTACKNSGLDPKTCEPQPNPPSTTH